MASLDSLEETENSMHSRYDVVIAGFGMVGMLLYTILLRYNVRVLVYDPFLSIEGIVNRQDLRASALSYSSWRLLDLLGLYQEGDGEAIHTIHIEDKHYIKDSHREEGSLLSFSREEVGGREFGWIIENKIIGGRVWTNLSSEQRRNIKLGTLLEDFREDEFGCHLTFADGHKVSTNLVIGSDGKKSATRTDAGIDFHRLENSQGVMTGTLQLSSGHENRAMERFMPDGPFALLPMTNNRASLIWTEKLANARSIMNFKREELEREIGERIGDKDIRILGRGLQLYELDLGIAKEYYRGRRVLVGDALHSIHPVAGQGLNLGIRDIAALSECIVRSLRSGMDVGVGEVLEQYAKWRFLDNHSMIIFTETINKLFSNDRTGLRLLRRAGLDIFANSMRVKRVFMRQAMGLSGRVPNLLLGREI